MVWAYASNCPCPFPHIEIKMKRDFQVTCARVLWFADCWLGWVANICSLGLQNCELQIAYATGRRTCRPFQVTCAPVHSILPCIRAGICLWVRVRPLLVYFINSNDWVVGWLTGGGFAGASMDGCGCGGWMWIDVERLLLLPTGCESDRRGVWKFHNDSPQFICNIQLTFAEFGFQIPRKKSTSVFSQSLKLTFVRYIA